MKRFCACARAATTEPWCVFDVADLAAALAGGTLVAARLELFIETNGANWGDGRSVDAHRLLADWSERGATWSCADDTEPEDQSPDCDPQWDGGSFDAVSTASVLHTNDLAGWIAFDVTADLFGLAGSTPGPFGWLIKKTEEGQNGLVEYTSREVCRFAPRLVLEIDAPVPDADPPRLAIISPADRFLINQPLPPIALAFADAGSDLDLGSLRVDLDGADLTPTCTVCEAAASCLAPHLEEGTHTLSAEIRDASGNLATTSFVFDLLLGDGEHRVTLPAIADSYLRSGAKNQSQGAETFLRVRSSGRNRALARFDVASAAPMIDRLHSATLELYIEHNAANWGPDGRPVDAHRLLVDWREAGVTWSCPDDLDPNDQSPDCDQLWNGGTFEPTPTASVDHTKELMGWIRYDVTADVDAILAAGDDFGWLIKKAQEGQNGLVEYTSKESEAAHAPRLVLVFDGGEPPDTAPPVDPDLPPDPATVAPPLDRTVATDLFTASAFLYTGDEPIQTGVEPGVIEPRRVAVLRGLVLDRDGNPLPGVEVTILDHPELGVTTSRADGLFDLAVNGGGPLTIDYRKAGYLPLQRRVDAPWRDYAWADDVAMTPIDQAVTAITTGAADAQVARGTVQSDQDGSRTATLVFQPGTLAEMVFADGSRQPLTTLDVRATEYTVGANGPLAMPGPLPANVAYTYAVELSADQAVAASAERVELSQPVAFYLERFIGFPVGSPVPAGFYDRTRGAWIGSDNGVVLAILGVDLEGRAELDIDGSGLPAQGETLDELGVTDAERTALAGLYAPGQALWRVPIPHFTPWDCNWPYTPPDDAEPPPGEDDDGDDNGDDDDDDDDESDADDDEDEDDPCEQSGSVIECENQVLRESATINGTPFRLVYHSDRVPGRTASLHFRTRLSGPSLPASLKRIELEIRIGGQRIKETFPPLPGQTFSFTWNGRDAYGRLVQGKLPVTIHKGYVYDLVYRRPADFARSWARFPNGSFLPPPVRRGISEVTVSRVQTGTIDSHAKSALGSWDAREQGLGGWSLDVNHVYDPNGRVLYPGSGGRRSARQIGPVVKRLAGQVFLSGFDGDGGPSRQAELSGPTDVAVAADGRLFIADTFNSRIRVVSTDGAIATFAGSGALCQDVGDADPRACGGDAPALDAQLTFPQGVAVAPDGGVLIADTGNGCIRRVDHAGTIANVAGVCEGFGGGESSRARRAEIVKDAELGDGDGGPATEALLVEPTDVAVAPDGSFLIADRFHHRVRRVGTDGVISTAAGGGTAEPVDGARATDVALIDPTGVALGPNGDLLVASELGNRVWRVSVDGRIFALAGNGALGDAGGSVDGGPATEIGLRAPWRIAAGPNGAVFIAERFAGRVRRVSSAGTISTVAGTAQLGSPVVDSGPAPGTGFINPGGLALTPEGDLAFADNGSGTVWVAGLALTGYAEEEIVIAAQRGSELYVFNHRGRHLRTAHALTGTDLLRFGYDDKGFLTEVEDLNGLVTLIERDVDGTPLRLVAPFGQMTNLGLGSNGYLANVRNPANEERTFAYDNFGRLHTWTDRRGDPKTADYDSFGRLLREEDSAGGFIALTRSSLAQRGTLVTLDTSDGRSTTFDTRRSRSSTYRRIRNPKGGFITLDARANGEMIHVRPDGTSVTSRLAPDPRFGMQRPVAKERTATLPSGLQATATIDRTVGFGDLSDPTAIDRLTESLTINGRTYSSSFERTTGLLVRTTPTGRQKVTRVDGSGRLIQSDLGAFATIAYGYDDAGRLASFSRGTDVNLRQTTFTYGADGRLSALRDPSGKTLTWDRDDVGRPTRLVLRDQRAMTFEYDENGRIGELVSPGGAPHGYRYSARGLLIGYDPPAVNGEVHSTTLEYTTGRQIQRIRRPDGQEIAFFYDANGQRTAIQLPTGAIAYNYDAQGGVQSISAPSGITVQHSYDGPLRTEVQWSGPVAGTVTDTFDNDFQVASRSVNGANPVAFAYDDDGFLIRAGAMTIARDPATGFVDGIALGTVDTGLGYNAFEELEMLVARAGGSDLMALQYTHDALGRVIEKVETIASVTSTFTYGYDDAGRLDRVEKNGLPFASYAYDANGNRTGYDGTFGNFVGSYDAEDRILAYSDLTFEHNAAGELTRKTQDSASVHYGYDALGNLISVTLADGRQIEYLLDGRNRRVGKLIDGTHAWGLLYSDLLNPVAMLDAAGNVAARFVYGTKSHVPDYLVKGGVTYAIVSDHLGSVRLVIDTTTGFIAQRVDYDELGRIVLDTNPAFQPFGFAGGLYDEQTGLIHFGARDYDPQLGRWLTKDPIGVAARDYNLYRYASVVSQKYLHQLAAPFAAWRRCSSSQYRGYSRVGAPCQPTKRPRDLA